MCIFEELSGKQSHPHACLLNRGMGGGGGGCTWSCLLCSKIVNSILHTCIADLKMGYVHVCACKLMYVLSALCAVSVYQDLTFYSTFGHRRINW